MSTGTDGEPSGPLQEAIQNATQISGTILHETESDKVAVLLARTESLSFDN